MTEELRILLSRVRRGWPLDSRVYPVLDNKPDLEDVALLSHILLHLTKQVGKLAGLYEPMLHGAPAPDRKEVSRQVAYTIIDVLRLAQRAGLDPSEILDNIDQWEREQVIVDKDPDW